MQLSVLGLSHKSAPVAIRERLCLSAEQSSKALRWLGTEEGAVLLSTCNRIELYATSACVDRSGLERLFAKFFPQVDLSNAFYFRSGKEAVQHLFRVAAGLDSMVVGENEILKQVKDSYELARAAGATNKGLNVLFQRALYVGKMVRTHTQIGQGALSVGSVAVSLAEKIFDNLSSCKVLVLGAGEMAELVVHSLKNKCVQNVTVANRTVEKAQVLAAAWNGSFLPLETALKQIAQFDVVISSLRVDQPILLCAEAEKILVQRRNRALFVIDIGVPRNIDASAHNLDNFYLYNIDDLQGIAEENLAQRRGEIDKAEKLVAELSAQFGEWMDSLQLGQEKSLKHDVRHILAS